ncbi:hypothetical protein [Bacillus sp. OK048]|uniref:hypothetical protein n=1 Tax=Bacillus sp. OK048 TaxID=1882761 RepID=UPI001C314AD9|nr:hypothetical protein [Bacillus sp. OK048]
MRTKAVAASSLANRKICPGDIQETLKLEQSIDKILPNFSRNLLIYLLRVAVYTNV